MKRPVVGIVTTWFERGAAYVSRAYRDALSPGCEVRIFARGGEQFAQGDPRWDGPEVWWTKPGNRTRIDRQQFERWARECGIEVVLFNEQEWWPPVLWAREMGIKSIAYVDYYTRQTVPWFWAYDALWCNTRRHFGVFERHPGARYIPWGTDLELYRPRERPAGDPLLFFHSAGMGGINLRKGTDLLVAAFAEVRGPARLIIHSQVPAAALGPVGEQIARDRRIQFVEGTVPAPGLYHMGDVYVYPTRLDGIGLTIAEALACGLPVIATDVAPCSEFIVPPTSGWLVPVARTRRRHDGYYWPEAECDVQALAAVLQDCVDRRAERPEWRRQARAAAERGLDWRKNAAGLPAAVTDLLAAPSHAVPPRLERAITRCSEDRPGMMERLGDGARRRLRRLRTAREACR